MPSPISGTTVYDLFSNNPEHPSIQAHRAALEGEARNFEVWVEVRGEPRLLRAHVEPLRDASQAIRGVVGVALDLTERVRAEADRERLIEELQQALDRVKVLSGLIPICSHCKAVRDDKGYWQQVDAFMREHSDAKLSHAICPECAQKLMPGAARVADIAHGRSGERARQEPEQPERRRSPRSRPRRRAAPSAAGSRARPPRARATPAPPRRAGRARRRR